MFGMVRLCRCIKKGKNLVSGCLVVEYVSNSVFVVLGACDAVSGLCPRLASTRACRGWNIRSLYRGLLFEVVSACEGADLIFFYVSAPASFLESSKPAYRPSWRCVASEMCFDAQSLDQGYSRNLSTSAASFRPTAFLWRLVSMTAPS